MTNHRSDNSNQEPEPVDELADLVAYLDGEMDEPSVELMERRLISDDPLRHEADALDETWQLLDSLEDVSASGGFKQKTLSSLETVSSGSESSQATVSRWRSMLQSKELIAAIVGWAVFGFVLASAGMTMGRLSARSRGDDSDTEILKRMPLLRKYHQYRLVPDAEFLRDLSLSSEPNRTGEPK